jgi:CheY-specific phosphatase CheX
MQELEREVVQVMESVLLGLLGEELDPPPALRDGPNLTCAVGIRGEWQGQVVVQVSYNLACVAVAKMFGVPPAQPVSAQDAQDALCEIANILAGNIKPLLGEANELGFPEDVSGAELSFPAASQLARASIRRNDGRLEVRVLEM